MSSQQGGRPPGGGPPYPQPPHPQSPHQPYPQQPQQPYPQQPQQPYPQQPQQPYPQQPYPPPPQQPYPQQPYSQQQQPYPPQPYPQPPYAAPAQPQPAPSALPPPPQPPPPPPAEAVFSRALGRAFRLRIEPNEVTPNEHMALVHATPPITDPHLKAFLAWRRSVLLLVAIALVPLTLLRLYDAFKHPELEKLNFLFLVPAAAEGALCLVCWYQLKNWMVWRGQRRTLFRAWLIFMAAPFVVFMVPVEDIAKEMAGGEGARLIQILVAAQALLTLAPKAVSLLAGTVRAAIVTKMLFPGAAGPGWLIVLATPLYTLFAFTLLILPYHITGSGYFFGAMIALAGGQLILARAGYQLAKPTTHEDAVRAIRKARATYLIAMLAFAACLLAALGKFADQIGAASIASTILSYETNVLILTLIGSDLLITNLERARGLSSGTAHLADETNRKLSAFVGEA